MSKNSELKKYIDIARRIRELSAPAIESISDAHQYRRELLDSFTEIGHLSRVDQQILDDVFYPLIESGHDLCDEELELLREFSNMLIDPTSLENLDLPVFYAQSRRLLEDAEERGDDQLIILALDNIVIAAYSMMASTLRLYPEYDICFKYRDVGIEAADRLTEYLDPERFVALPDDHCRETVLINARYMGSMFEWDDYSDEDYIRKTDEGIGKLERALALAYDPFYREAAPNYDWNYHIFRTLQYITCLPEYSDYSRFSPEQHELFYQYAVRLSDFLHEEMPEMMEECTEEIQRLYLLRGEYLTKRIDAKTLKKGLLELWEKRDLSGGTFWEVFPNVCVPYEYILATDEDDLSDQDIVFLTSLYPELLEYIYKLPKVGVLVFLLAIVTYILRHFIQVPGGITFEDFMLKLLAVLHPPTYVHVLSVAEFASCLTGHLVDRCPERFIGILDLSSEEEVRSHKSDLMDLSKHGALLHDVGKLYIIETIMTYGRKLLKTEFDLIETHPSIGANVLEKYSETAKYANMAKGHHKWYDDSRGYPPEFKLRDAEDRTMIDILAVADCLDASTDLVGRNYKIGKTFEEYMEELEEGRGTRYAPFVVDVIKEEDVLADIRYLLDNVRDENYIKTYELLKNM